MEKTETLLRESRVARRNAEIERRNAATNSRIVQNTEAESIASAEQRRSEEQKRIAEQERARAARRRNKKRSDQNSKLKLLVNASSVDAVSAAQKKQKEAEKKIQIVEGQLIKEKGKIQIGDKKD